jgi:predicted transcriptional regulator of viral defense system
MKLIEALKLIRQLKISVFRTNDIATYLKITTPHASKILKRLSNSKHLIYLKKGLWAISDKIDPLVLPNYLLKPLPSYISFQTALYYRNVIDQIPDIIYVATLHKTIKIKTPIATISAHQIKSDFFFGYTYDESTGIKMATAEKALIDVFYLHPTKSGFFKSLPELDMDEIDLDKARKIIKKITSKRRRTIVLNQFKALLG